ncbi:SusC/RagA family TonB-linked outer membrane protein [Agriterribacter sp.]|uniref:SusC/RagA family TonB-linked outer membrane protein n=1 Tax=Agriterribacter sp. TaxID=2821509 RepID=UPI002B7BB52F|nr:SusC/RagA family TonB-linked outer membrane protein [Agriterribacter sp.]HRP55467.1 SusC/RagA family TonB-linked outer membrane protein [Agriterribacter sp.]
MFNDYLPLRYLSRLLPVLIVTLSCCLYATAQQQVIIKGKVGNTKGEPLVGASITIKGTSTGVLSDMKGEFSIACTSSDILIFTYSGFGPQERPVSGTTAWSIVLEEAQSVLSEVVVAALGIQRQARGLTYATQKVAGTELTKVPQTNMINALSGKVAGMTISRSAAGLGGSAKVLLRGSKSAAGSNQPLYVIDGVPLTNFTRESANASFSMADQGDGISNLNPDDIESMSVLKGASAASLYGSQAANGVILITTKKGKAGVSKIDVSSGLTVDAVAYTPKLQHHYGQTAPGSPESWGAPVSTSYDNVSDFFQKGNTWINSVGFSSGTEKMQTYLSYANTSAKGIVEGNTMGRHNFNFRQSAQFLNNKLKLEGNLNMITQTVNNNPVFGFQSGPLFGLYTFPRGQDMSPYKKDFEVLDPVRNLYVQNWPFITADNQNPYWVINRNLYKNKRFRTVTNITARYDITEWMNIQLRGNMDRTNDYNTAKYYVGTAAVYAGLNGRYNVSDITTTQLYGDALLNINKNFNDIQLTAILGSSITDSRNAGESLGSNEMYIPNVFTIQNMSRGVGTSFGAVSAQHQQLQAVFGNISLSYKNWLYMDVTGRNDWSSNLSYTPNGSYFYPSGGLTVLLDQLLNLPQSINLLKIRGSYAVVGNTVPIYVTNPINYLTGVGDITFNNTAPFTDLKPEKTRSLELGAEFRLLQNRLSGDVTWYKTNSINQFFSVAVPPGTGYSRRFINGGDIQNSGVEASLNFRSVSGRNFSWNTGLNFGRNKNVIRKLTEEVDQFVLSDDINNYSSILKVGGSYGDIYAQVLSRDEKTGQVFINDDGTPVVQGGARQLVGNANPDFRLGWNNSISYKWISLDFLVDGSFGGEVMSLTEQILDGYGASAASGKARDEGGLTVDGIRLSDNAAVAKVDAEKWYKTVGGRQHVTGEYMYDATTVRVREVSLGFTLPKSFLTGDFIKGIRFSLIGRNLVYLYKKAPYDPELTYSTGNGYSGIDVFGLPATRSFGGSLNVSF